MDVFLAGMQFVWRLFMQIATRKRGACHVSSVVRMNIMRHPQGSGEHFWNLSRKWEQGSSRPYITVPYFRPYLAVVKVEGSERRGWLTGTVQETKPFPECLSFGVCTWICSVWSYVQESLRLDVCTSIFSIWSYVPIPTKVWFELKSQRVRMYKNLNRLVICTRIFSVWSYVHESLAFGGIYKNL